MLRSFGNSKINSELGIRNSELFMLRKFIGNINSVGQILYLSDVNPVFFGKFSVGDGSPVPRRKAFSDEFGIICVPQITAKTQMTGFLSYAAKCFIINERPCFQRFYPMKTGSFCLWKIYMLKIADAIRNGNRSLQNSVLRNKYAELILNTNKIKEKICAEIAYIQDCRLDFF